MPKDAHSKNNGGTNFHDMVLKSKQKKPKNTSTLWTPSFKEDPWKHTVGKDPRFERTVSNTRTFLYPCSLYLIKNASTRGVSKNGRPNGLIEGMSHSKNTKGVIQQKNKNE